MTIIFKGLIGVVGSVLVVCATILVLVAAGVASLVAFVLSLVTLPLWLLARRGSESAAELVRGADAGRQGELCLPDLVAGV